MSDINSHKISLIEGLFKREIVFKIPTFQRSYTWDLDLIQELWVDILENVLDQNNGREHFMGVFIFADEEGERKVNSLAEEIVIDGQQRMTSFTILLRAMYDSLTKEAEYIAEDIYSAIRGGDSEEESYDRVILGEDAREFFNQYIQEKDAQSFRGRRKGKTKIEKRIVKAYLYFLEMLAKEAKNRKLNLDNFIGLLFRKLKQRVVAVRIKVDSDADAYTIFETINSKKVELSVSELLKNYLFQQSERVSKTELKNAEKKWEEIIENLNSFQQNNEEIEPSQFIRHFWISNVEAVTEKKLYLAIKNNYKNSGNKIKTLTSDLAKQSLLYSKIAGANKEDDDKIIDLDNVLLLDQIRTLRVRQCYPLLLSALSIQVSKVQFKELLKSIIRASLLRSLTDRNPNELEAVYTKNALSLRKNGNMSITKILSEINSTTPTGEAVTNYLLRHDETSVSEQMAKFLLIQQENKLRTPETHLDKVSLEHILPKSPQSLEEWKMSEDDHRNYVGKLGNLVLLGNKLNSEASNKPFTQKKKVLMNTDIKSTKALIKGKTKWGKKDIENRTEELAKFAVENWI